MTRKITALNSKGGVGKSTTLANLGGLLADMGARMLLFDGDIQPTLSKYYPLEYEAPHGPRNLLLIKSNDGNARLQFWLDARPVRRTRLAVALSAPIIEDNFDFVLIDPCTT